MFLGAFLFFGFLRFGRLLLLRLTGRRRIAAKELIEQRKGSRPALGAVLLVFVVTLAEHGTHFIAEHIQVFLRNAHLLYHLVNLRQTQAASAFEAIALVEHIAAFHLCYKYNCNILFALYAHFRLHDFSLLQRELFFERQYSTFVWKMEKQIMND